MLFQAHKHSETEMIFCNTSPFTSAHKTRQSKHALQITNTKLLSDSVMAASGHLPLTTTICASEKPPDFVFCAFNSIFKWSSNASGLNRHYLPFLVAGPHHGRRRPIFPVVVDLWFAVLVGRIGRASIQNGSTEYFEFCSDTDLFWVQINKFLKALHFIYQK